MSSSLSHSFRVSSFPFGPVFVVGAPHSLPQLCAPLSDALLLRAGLTSIKCSFSRFNQSLPYRMVLLFNHSADPSSHLGSHSPLKLHSGHASRLRNPSITTHTSCSTGILVLVSFFLFFGGAIPTAHFCYRDPELRCLLIVTIQPTG